MKNIYKTILVKLVVVFLLAGVVGAAYAQSGGGYDLTWNTIDGGGATFNTGGNYALGGTAGQADAGMLTGGSYSLGGGFWHGAPVIANYELYLPLVMRNAN